MHASRRKEIEFFAELVLHEFPRCPADDARRIAEYATEPGSGRVGRSKTMPLQKVVELAAGAFVRHCKTSYDERRKEVIQPQARNEVTGRVKVILAAWRGLCELSDN